MTSGVLRLDAGELAAAARQIQRWNPQDVTLADARIVLGLLTLSQTIIKQIIGKWNVRVDMETMQLEAQDISVDDIVYFPKQAVLLPVRAVVKSPVEPGYIRLGFLDFFLDVDPTELFDLKI